MTDWNERPASSQTAAYRRLSITTDTGALLIAIMMRLKRSGGTSIGVKRGELNSDDSALVDKIYEAAVIPDLWHVICDLVSLEIGAYSASLISIAPEGTMRWVASKAIAEHMVTFESSDLAQSNIRPQRALEISPGSFLRDVDILTPAEMESDRLRNELLCPLGLAWEMGAVIQEPSGSLLIHSILRRTEDGPFDRTALDRANALKADLTRAAFLSTRLAFQQAKTVAQALSDIGLPAAVIGDNANVLATNPEMDALSDRIRIGFRNRILLANRQANALFQEALEHLRSGLPSLVQSIPISADESSPPLVLQLVPVRRSARDIFHKSMAIVIATPVGSVGPPSLRVICGLFDLTPMEARIAQDIGAGRSVEETAILRGVGRETVRTHIKAIYRKTGVNRQAQLASLLSGLASPTRIS